MNLATRLMPALLGMLVFAPGLALARPAVIENVSTIKNPNPALWTEFPVSVAVDGDSAIVTAQRWSYPSPEHGRVHQTGFLYQRGASGWTLVRQLAETVVDGGSQNSLSVAMKGGLAAVHTTPMSIYLRGASGWTLAPSEVTVSESSGFDLNIDGGRIINGEGACAWNAVIIEKQSDGVWRRTAALPGAYRGCASFNRGGAVDIAGDLAVVNQQFGDEVPFGEEQTWIFHRDANGWQRQGVASIPSEGRFWAYPQVALHGQDVLVSGGHENGIYVFRDLPGQGFKVAERIRPLDNFMGGGETFQLERSANYLLQKANMFDRGPVATAINVYERCAGGKYEHKAVLVARQNKWTWFPYEKSSSNVASSGRTVLATDTNEQVVYHFELPATLATPAPRQDTFSVGNAPDWQPSAGSQYTVLRGDRSRVLRQTQTSGETKAIYQAADFTSQAIELDVKAGQFAAPGAAISLITRWQGPHNYYEFVWGPQRFEFRRMASGTLRTLVSYPNGAFNPTQSGRNYRMRLESIGTQHRVYIDGLLYLDVVSTGPTRGQVGVGTYSAAADFDNVLVSPTPVYSMYRKRFFADEAMPWSPSGAGSWNLDVSQGNNIRMVQSSMAGEGRVTIGVPATEQSVETRARVVSFAAPTGTQRRWFGVVARYVDADNHYVLALRNSNALVLSKRVHGVDTTLGSFTVNVVPGRYYTIRLDAIGTQLRAYLDNRLLFEAADDAHPSGNSGLATFKAHAEFGGFVAYQP